MAADHDDDTDNTQPGVFPRDVLERAMLDHTPTPAEAAELRAQGILLIDTTLPVEMDAGDSPDIPAFRRFQELGMARQTTLGLLPSPPSRVSTWRDAEPDADGVWRLTPYQPPVAEAWWLKAQRWFLKEICTALAIPADYLTETRREQVTLALDEVRDRIEQHLGDY